MKWVMAVLLAAAVAAGVYYGVRAGGGTSTGPVPDARVEWTAEAIAVDPEGYLAFAEAETVRELKNLDAREASLDQVRGRVRGMLDEATQRIDLGTRVLDELVACFRQAEAGKGFPAQWRGEARTEAWLEQNIVALHKLVESRRQLRASLEHGLKTVDAQRERLHAERGKAQETLARIRANREFVKADRVSGESTQRVQEIAAAIEGFGKQGEPLGLERLAIDAPPPPDPADLRKILGDR